VVCSQTTGLAAGQRRVDGVEDAAEPQQRPPRLEELGPVRQHDGHDVAAADTERAQAAGHLADAMREFAVRPRDGLVADEGRLLELVRARLQQLGQRGDVDRQHGRPARGAGGPTPRHRVLLPHGPEAFHVKPRRGG
jgi:hypothetical protein